MSDDRRALLYGLGAILAWSTIATAMKLALRQLEVLQLLLYAVICSAAALLVIVWRQGHLQLLWHYLRESPAYFAIMGLVNPLLYYLILLRAYELLPAQQAQTINFTWAILLALLSVPLLGQRLSWRDLLAALLGYCGVVVIATRGDLLSLQFSSGEGVFYALCSTVIWALYWIANTRNRREPIASLCLNFLLAIPCTWLACVLFSTPRLSDWNSLWPAVYIGLFEMGLAFALWTTALRLTSSVARVGNLIFLAPMLSLCFIALVLGEAIHPATLVGLGMIIPAVLLQHSQPAAVLRD
jgi:drug/metabolite transporter (DMT)-like permease